MAKDVSTTFNAWSFSFTDQEKEVLYLTNNDIPVKSTEMTAPRLVLGSAYTANFNDNLALTAELNMEFSFDGRRNVLLSSSAVNIDPRMGIELGFKELLFGRVGIYNFQQATFPKYIQEIKPEKFYQPVIKISRRPDKEILQKLVWEMSCVKIGEMFGVSDNAVNKWCKIYGISKPGRGDWEKLKAGKIDKPE